MNRSLGRSGLLRKVRDTMLSPDAFHLRVMTASPKGRVRPHEIISDGVDLGGGKDKGDYPRLCSY